MTRNYITPKIVEWLGIPCRQKKYLYLLVIILKEPVLYRDGVINFKTGPVQVSIEGRNVVINFNILLLG